MVAGFLPFEDPKTSNLYKNSVDDIRQHPWYRQFTDKTEEGLYPQKEFMPLNNTVYEKVLEQFGFDADYTVKCIEANRHNNITAAYHLLFKKAQRLNRPYVATT